MDTVTKPLGWKTDPFRDSELALPRWFKLSSVLLTLGSGQVGGQVYSGPSMEMGLK